MATRRVGDTEAIRIYGPYPDKRDASKWSMLVFAPGNPKAVVVPTVGFDLAPLHSVLGKMLFENLVDRAGKSKEGEAEPDEG